jgi:hypothetical protein
MQSPRNINTPARNSTNTHVSMGAAGHWIKTAGILAPFIIGEFVNI